MKVDRRRTGGGGGLYSWEEEVVTFDNSIE